MILVPFWFAIWNIQSFNWKTRGVMGFYSFLFLQRKTLFFLSWGLNYDGNLLFRLVTLRFFVVFSSLLSLMVFVVNVLE